MVEQDSIELYENLCCVCYGSIEQTRGGRLRRTCSSACRQKLYRMRHKVEPKPRRGRPRLPSTHPKAGECVVCGEAFVGAKTGRKRKTCSDACRQTLWRRQHPRCKVCGKPFKLAKYQREMKYCSPQCNWKARDLKRAYERRMNAVTDLAWFRPYWIPAPGNGYRSESIPWKTEGEEQDAIEWEREPEPEYVEEADYPEPVENISDDEAREARRKKVQEERERIRLFRELFIDDSKWW